MKIILCFVVLATAQFNLTSSY